MAGTYLYFRCPCPMNENIAGTSCAASNVCRYAEITPSTGSNFSHSPMAFSLLSPEKKMVSGRSASSSQLRNPNPTYGFTEKTTDKRSRPSDEFKWIPYRNQDLSSTEKLKQTAKEVSQRSRLSFFLK